MATQVIAIEATKLERVLYAVSVAIGSVGTKWSGRTREDLIDARELLVEALESHEG